MAVVALGCSTRPVHRPVETTTRVAAPAPTAPVRHVVRVDGHPISVWEKRPVGTPRGALLLVHGRTWSALPDFDLQVRGESLSLMDGVVARGWAVYAVDLRGYGGTPRDATGWLTPARAVADVAAVLDWIATNSRVSDRPAVLGWSLGSTVAQLVAQRHPDRLSALVAYGYGWDPDEEDPDAAVAAASTPPRLPNTAEAAASDFITPGSISQRAVAAYVAAALAADPVRVDWKGDAEWRALDPAAVKVPTLILQGAQDPAASTEVCAKLFTRLGTADRAWVTLPGGDHAAHLEVTRARFLDALFAFLERPR